MSRSAHQLVNQNSAEVEIFTPPAILAAAWFAMGAIDLDPASCAKANETVGAARFFTIADDGLRQPWAGRVWLNHPFGRAEKPCGPRCKKKHAHHTYPLYGNEAWIRKVLLEVVRGHVPALCMITFAATSERWFRPLLRRPQFYLNPRTQYILPGGQKGEGTTKGSVVTYFGRDLPRFVAAFSRLHGEIKVAWDACLGCGLGLCGLPVCLNCHR